MNLSPTQAAHLYAEIDFQYNHDVAAGFHSQTNGVIAAMALTAFVFLLGRHPTRPLRALVLLPILFVTALGASFGYAVASADQMQTRQITIYFISGTLYFVGALTLVAIFQILLRDHTPDRLTRTGGDFAFWGIIVGGAGLYASGLADVARVWVDETVGPTGVLKLALTFIAGAIFFSLVAWILIRDRQRLAVALAGSVCLQIVFGIIGIAVVSAQLRFDPSPELSERLWSARWLILFLLGAIPGVLHQISSVGASEQELETPDKTVARTSTPLIKEV